MTTGLVYDPACPRHHTGPGRPKSPARLAANLRHLEEPVYGGNNGLVMLYLCEMSGRTMNAQQEIESHLTEIRDFCREHGIRRLEVFGSTVHGKSPQDIDFLVDIGDLPAGEYAGTYFALQEYLESLFKRPVDLVTPAGLENPYFRQRVEAEAQLLYAA